MGRPAKFSVEQILDAARELVVSSGPSAATVTTIAERMGAPSGSIYHRFASRDLLLASLWIRTARRAQVGFTNALAAREANAEVVAALHLPRWSREHLDDARILMQHRREALIERWPDELGDQLAELNNPIDQAVRDYAMRRYGRMSPEEIERVVFALIDVPYAAVRRYLAAGNAPPASIDKLITSTVQHLLTL